MSKRNNYSDKPEQEKGPDNGSGSLHPRNTEIDP